MAKPTFKDSQLTIRINGEILEAMKHDANEANLSMADFVVRLYESYKDGNDVSTRLAALERAVFQKSQAA